MAMRWWLTGALALSLVGCGTSGPVAIEALDDAALEAQAAKQPARAFTLATYNIRNLFDGSTVALDPKKSPEKSPQDKKMLAKAFRELNADVVGLEEVESKGTLRKFRDSYLSDMGYKYMALIEGNDSRGIDVGVLSRFPISRIRSHKTNTFNVPGESQPHRLSRDLLQATISPGKGYSFTLFVTHLKSQHGGDYADKKRKAEAQEIRRILQNFERSQPRANYALMGDLNDVPTSAPINVLLGGQPKLFDVLKELGNSYTYHPQKYRSRIDYIMLSEGMHHEYVKGSARIFNSDTTRAASDHLPARVTIDATRDR